MSEDPAAIEKWSEYVDKYVVGEDSISDELRDQLAKKPVFLPRCGTHETNVACLPEMMTLFSCLAEKNYDSKNCSKEATAFQGCFNKFLKQNAQYKATGSLGILTPGLKASQMTSQQANALLKKYPIVNLLKKVR